MKIALINEFNEDALNREVQNIKSRVDSGEVNPLEMVINLKAYKDVIEKAIKELSSDAIGEAEKYTKDDRKLMGAKFDVRSTGARYNWNEDPEYARLSQQLKDRTELLKTAVRMKELVVDEDGIEVPKCTMKSADMLTLSVSFK